MNCELLQCFYRGQIAVEIETNEQANQMMELAEAHVPNISEGCEPWSDNDFLEYPYIIVEGTDSPYINGKGLKPRHMRVVSYDEVMTVPDEPDLQNINLEEVL